MLEILSTEFCDRRNKICFELVHRILNEEFATEEKIDFYRVVILFHYTGNFGIYLRLVSMYAEATRITLAIMTLSFNNMATRRDTDRIA